MAPSRNNKLDSGATKGVRLIVLELAGVTVQSKGAKTRGLTDPVCAIVTFSRNTEVVTTARSRPIYPVAAERDSESSPTDNILPHHARWEKESADSNDGAVMLKATPGVSSGDSATMDKADYLETSDGRSYNVTVGLVKGKNSFVIGTSILYIAPDMADVVELSLSDISDRSGVAKSSNKSKLKSWLSRKKSQPTAEAGTFPSDKIKYALANNASLKVQVYARNATDTGNKPRVSGSSAVLNSTTRSRNREKHTDASVADCRKKLYNLEQSFINAYEDQSLVGTLASKNGVLSPARQEARALTYRKGKGASGKKARKDLRVIEEFLDDISVTSSIGGDNMSSLNKAKKVLLRRGIVLSDEELQDKQVRREALGISESSESSYSAQSFHTNDRRGQACSDLACGAL